MPDRDDKGFSLIEVMVALAIGIVLMIGVVNFLREGLDLSHTVMERGELQQNARAALNMIVRDLSIAGTGVPPGGIQLPTGAGTQDPLYACDFTACVADLVSNNYFNDHLYAIHPGDGLGPTINGVATDTVTLVYADDRLNLNQFPPVSVNSSGTQISVNAATNPPINDPIVGLIPGDIIMVQNNNGSAAGVVTSVPNNTTINLAAGDPLRFNQPTAPAGNIARILTPASPCNAFRLVVITYYVGVLPGADGIPGNADDVFRLMRQVNAQPPVPIAESVQDLQITYDLYDENLAVATADQPDAGGTPNQIRKATVSVSFRSPVRGPFRGNLETVSLSTAVSARNLSFRDRYQ